LSKNNLIPCQNCGNWRQLHAICDHCYSKVRKETEEIKERLLKKYKGTTPDQESLVVYEGEKEIQPKEYWKGKRIVEMEKKRPQWFSSDLKKRWHKLGVTDASTAAD